MTVQSKDLSVMFVNQFGGKCIDPKHLHAHALKTLEEMVELCVACGAQESDIRSIVDVEIQKAKTKGEFVVPNQDPQHEPIQEEIADVSICLDVLAHHAQIDTDQAKLKKLPVLLARKFSPNKYGVLKRPDRIDPQTGE